MTLANKYLQHANFFKRLGIVLSGLVFLAATFSTTLTYALTSADFESIQNSTPFYNPEYCGSGGSGSGTSTDSTCCGSSGVGVVTGTLPSIIPDPYNSAFTAGGENNKVSPALVAAIFTEENFTGSATSQLKSLWANFAKSTQPDPNSGWAYSHVPANEVWPNGETPNAIRGGAAGLPANGAGGPFQFEPETWSGLGLDVDNNSEENILNAANGAGQYLASNGATINTPPASWAAYPNGAIWHYNAAQFYVNAVMTYYNFYNSGSSTTLPTAVAPTSCGGGTTTSDVSCQGVVPAGTSTLSTVRQTAVCVAENEYSLWQTHKMYPGFRECTGNPADCTSFAKYSENRNELWCADFASWAYHEAGYNIPNSGDYSLPAVYEIYQAGTEGGKNGRWSFHAIKGYTPVPGDLAIHYEADSSLPYIHVNMVVSVKDGVPTLIGGDEVGPDFPDGSVVSEDTYTGDVIGYVSPNGT